MNNQSLDQSIDVLAQALKAIAAEKTAVFDKPFLDFHAQQGETNYGKGIIFSGQGTTKQFLLTEPDRFFSSEHIEVAKDRGFYANGLKVLDSKELGSTVTKSSLREVGRLKGLIVDGSVSIDNYLYYNSDINRLGFGTESPNAALSVAEMGIEVMLGTSEQNHGIVGTYASTDFDIVTDNTSRIAVKANGDVVLGNFNRAPIQVTVNGKLSLGVKTPDPNVDLHVAGAVRLNNKLHMVSDLPPTKGNFNKGDIVWNSNPQPRGCIGWVCTRSGDPGEWNPFGTIT
jgi:hypothetical protein